MRGITRRGDRVEIRLTKPDQSFLHLLGMRVLTPVARENVVPTLIEGVREALCPL